MSGSLEDETQQPRLAGPPRSTPLAPPLATPIAKHQTEPTLTDEPTLLNSLPPPFKTHTGLVNQSQAASHPIPESEESDRLAFDSLKRTSPGPSGGELGSVKDGSLPDISMARMKPRSLSPVKGSVSPVKGSVSPAKLSPGWATQSPAAGEEVDNDNEEVENHNAEDEDEDQIATDVSELQDSLPPDDASFPTPPDSQEGKTPPQPANATRVPPEESPMLKLTDHPTPVFPRSANVTPQKPQSLRPTYVSPQQRGVSQTHIPLQQRANSHPSPATRTTTTVSRPKRSFSPAFERDSLSDDEFTSGMISHRDRLHAIFNPKEPAESPEQEEDSLDPFGEGTSIQSSFDPPQQLEQLEQTFLNPSGSAADSVAVSSTQHNTPPAPDAGDTLIDEPADLVPATSTPPRISPTTQGRFTNLDRAPSSPLPPADIFSDIGSSYRRDNDDDNDDAHSFKATQINPDMPDDESQSPVRPLFSPARPPAVQSPVRRTVSAIPLIPEHRRLQRRAQTSVSDGQRSAVIKNFHREQSPIEPTFIDATLIDGPGSMPQHNATAQPPPPVVAQPPPPIAPPVVEHVPARKDRDTRISLCGNVPTKSTEPPKPNSTAPPQPVPRLKPSTKPLAKLKGQERGYLKPSLPRNLKPTAASCGMATVPSSKLTPPPVAGPSNPTTVPSPTRTSPNKYGKRFNVKRKRVAASDDEEDAGRVRSTRSRSARSGSSESTQEDPEDHTYKEPPPAETMESQPDPIGGTPPSPSPVPSEPEESPPKAKRPAPKIKLRIGKAGGGSTSAPAEAVQGSRGKRKAMSPSLELSGPSSDSEPEDLEDYTYRPVKKVKGKAVPRASVAAPPAAAPRTATKAAPRTSKAASRAAQPSKKKAKTTAAAAAGPSRAGSRSVSGSARAPSAAPSEMPSGTPAATIPDGPIRVLAYWKQTNEYFAGTVDARMKTGYRVKFDDGLTTTVPLTKMRLLDIKAGEPVLNGSKTMEHFIATAPCDGTGDVLHVLDNSSEPLAILVKDVVVLPDTIEKRFGKRTLDASVLEARFPLPVPKAAARVAVPSATPLSVGLHGKVFLLSRGDSRVSIDKIKRRIEKNGGMVEENWAALFSINKDSCALKTPLVPFVLQVSSKTVVSSKIMAALASGIPILAARYVDDAIENPAVDWRSYLVAAGETRYFFPSESARPVSQVVDPHWGDSSAGWAAADARALRRPFEGKRILFVEPVTKKFVELKELVPFCLTALGARVEWAKGLPEASSLAAYDLVLVEDRDSKASITREHKASGKLVNTMWLKECLPIGKCLPAQLAAGPLAE